MFACNAIGCSSLTLIEHCLSHRVLFRHVYERCQTNMMPVEPCACVLVGHVYTCPPHLAGGVRTIPSDTLLVSECIELTVMLPLPSCLFLSACPWIRLTVTIEHPYLSDFCFHTVMFIRFVHFFNFKGMCQWSCSPARPLNVFSIHSFCQDVMLLVSEFVCLSFF